MLFYTALIVLTLLQYIYNEDTIPELKTDDVEEQIVAYSESYIYEYETLPDVRRIQQIPDEIIQNLESFLLNVFKRLVNYTNTTLLDSYTTFINEFQFENYTHDIEAL